MNAQSQVSSNASTTGTPTSDHASRQVTAGGQSLHTVQAPSLERSRLAQRLRRVLKGEVMFDMASRGRYATDASIYQITPLGVIVPYDDTDVLAAIDIAAQMKIALLPRGAGTSQCGQTVGEALVIDTTRRLRAISNFDAQAATVCVQPGVVLDDLNAWLKPHGLWFPVDVSTSAQATLGGMAGNNSCGSRSIAYGNMVHNVLGIDAVLADGTEQYFGAFGNAADAAQQGSVALGSARASAVVSRLFEIAERERAEIDAQWPKVMRRVGGYNLDIFNPQSSRPYTEDGSVNLAHLLIGSEGTLAYSKRLHLKLSPLPTHKTLGVVNFRQFRVAMESAQHIVKLMPTAVELVDRTMIDLARQNPAFKPVIETALVNAAAPTPQAILLVEFAGDDAALLKQKLAQLADLMSDLGQPGSVVPMVSAAEQKALWDVRKAGLNIMMSLRGDGKPVSFIEDCAVPLEHLADYTDALSEVFTRHGTRGTWYAHASVGTLHVRPILDMRQQGEQGGAARMRAIASEASALVRQFKGAYSGEHGDGLVRSEWVAWQFGPRLTSAFEQIKDLFDPHGLMNPGKIVRSPKMDQASLFRYPPGYAALPLQPALDWSAWNVQNDALTEQVSAPGTGQDPAQGLAKAVEMCNNNGHCRKFDAGAMCPSFRVTRKEQHLTRGRANTLRLAISGQLEGGLAGSAVRDAMALCVGCKACKRECPTGIDMARMKIEVTHQVAAQGQLRMRDKLIAYLPRYAPFAARLAWLLNLRDRLPGLPWLTEKLFGIAAGRSLPHWQGEPFLRSATGKSLSADQLAPQAESDPDTLREVVLWADTFSNTFEPQVLQAATRVLRAAGYRVRLVMPGADDLAPGRGLCCGRTYLAAGMVDQARQEAQRSLRWLRPHLERGVAVIGLEPSCILTMKDEYLVMGLGDLAEKLASQAMLFEQFLVREHDAGRLQLPLQPLAQKALLHGHCHQKAFGLMSDVQRALQLIPQLDVTLIESSCCGMAGAFGFEAEHFETSQAMGELSLLPAVRSAPDDSLIIADGTSCRHQIADGAKRDALHVAEVFAMAITRQTNA